MQQPDSPQPESPAELCGYPVDSALSPECKSFLAIGPGGRGVVLKKVADDCLLGDTLHPSIRERLGRVRELAHGGVANLFGVEREGRDAWLVWEYLEGQTLDAHLSVPGRGEREAAVAGRELALAVDLLHMQGIVHGAVHAGNVIVSPVGAVKLTHVSPLLYDDPAADVDGVITLLESVAAKAAGAGPAPAAALPRLLARARAEGLGLRGLAVQLGEFIESPHAEGLRAAADVEAEHRGPRRRALYAAAVVTLLGGALSYGAWRAAGSPAVRAKVQDWLGPARLDPSGPE
jgi:hypothetical protein